MYLKVIDFIPIKRFIYLVIKPLHMFSILSSLVLLTSTDCDISLRLDVSNIRNVSSQGRTRGNLFIYQARGV